jgi:ABC-type glycerol-3-phosphate transport system permease component
MQKNNGKKTKNKKRLNKAFLVIFLIIIFLLIGWLLFSFFQKNNNDKEPVVGTIPSQVQEFLSQQDIDEFKELDFPVYFGFNPPNIEGTYRTDSKKVDYDKKGIFRVGMNLLDQDNTFRNQTENFEIVFDDKILKSGTVSKGKGGFISGEGNCFTVYQKKVANRSGCISTTVELMSGCLDENQNIKDYKSVIKMIDIRNKFICRILKYLKKPNPMPEGNVRITSESDGLAKKIE